ncbi:hypothetical protein LPJ66_004571 [Kickxella alabastrina]|uniref:Uncharacterized protein n=1 Tax=Kickxella alabastrina TaxID=61397 RepID=A0ACC1IGM3_9FUNG|nr:hypothetical protein LPJ66_004571 [Kickxella alabastrina]
MLSTKFATIAAARSGKTFSTASITARSLSTAAAEYAGSTNYVAGKQGYAPGFPPPKNWRDVPRTKPQPKLASDLPAPKPVQVPSQASAARQYRQRMRELRYGYLHSHLDGEQGKRDQRKESLAHMRVVHAERREKLKMERMVYETQVRADPLSAENVLNAEGLTLLPNIPGATAKGQGQNQDARQPRLHDIESPGYTLAPPRVSISMPAEANAQRDQERRENRHLTRQNRHEDNVQAMMTLFHDAESFVHYDNMDKKIFEFLNVLSVSQRTLSEMMEDLNKTGGVATSTEIAHRSVELRNMLQGTTGNQGKLGYDGMMQWLKSHPEDAEGIQQVKAAKPSSKQ